MARSLPLTDEMIQFCLIRGFLPEICKYIIESNPTSLEALIKSARRGEAALAASQLSSREAKLQAQVDTLMKNAANSTLAAVDPSDSQRHVSFADNRRNSTPPRSSSPMFRQPSENRICTRPHFSDNSSPRPNEQYNRRAPSPEPWRRSSSQQSTKRRPENFTPASPSTSRPWTPRTPQFRTPRFQQQQPTYFGNLNSCSNCARVHFLIDLMGPLAF